MGDHRIFTFCFILVPETDDSENTISFRYQNKAKRSGSVFDPHVGSVKVNEITRFRKSGFENVCFPIGKVTKAGGSLSGPNGPESTRGFIIYKEIRFKLNRVVV